MRRLTVALLCLAAAACSKTNTEQATKAETAELAPMFQGIPLTVTQSTLPPGFVCRKKDEPGDYEVTCDKPDHRGTYMGFPTQSLDVSFQKSGKVWSISTDLPAELLHKREKLKFKVLELQIEQSGTLLLQTGYWTQYAMRDGSVVRLTMFRASEGMHDSLSVTAFGPEASAAIKEDSLQQVLKLKSADAR